MIVPLEKDTKSWSSSKLLTAESLSCTFKVAEQFLFLGINTENWYSKACTRCPGSFQKFELSVSVLDFLQGLCLVKGTFLEASEFYHFTSNIRGYADAVLFEYLYDLSNRAVKPSYGIILWKTRHVFLNKLIE